MFLVSLNGREKICSHSASHIIEDLVPSDLLLYLCHFYQQKVVLLIPFSYSTYFIYSICWYHFQILSMFFGIPGKKMTLEFACWVFIVILKSSSCRTVALRKKMMLTDSSAASKVQKLSDNVHKHIVYYNCVMYIL